MLHLSPKRSLCYQVSRQIKKLVVVLVTFRSITNKKTEEELEWVSYIWYLITFKNQTEFLLDLESEVNIMSLAFAQKVGFKINKTNVWAQKIDGTILETYRIIIFTFFVSDKDDKKRFFEENFLLANVKLDIVLVMTFLTMSNIDVKFEARD